jgi:GNAT superfamily N-acetyltransferase
LLAALKLLKRILKKYGRPRKIVTDRLCSYSAAMKEVGAADRHEVGVGLVGQNQAGGNISVHEQSERLGVGRVATDYTIESELEHVAESCDPRRGGIRLNRPRLEPIGSAVCASPNHRGKGYAALPGSSARFVRKSSRHSLHVFTYNVWAIASYEQLGFTTRQTLRLTVLSRAADQPLRFRSARTDQVVERNLSVDWATIF